MKGDFVVKTVKTPHGIIVRTVAIATLLSVALAWSLASKGSITLASGVIETPTQATPWGVAFDKSGHIWVAEPGCDPIPICQSAFPSYIGEYNTSNATLIQNYLQPSGFSSPLFVAIDSTGHIWFTEPNSNAIGRLIPGSKPDWEQWTIPTANAIPYDLVVDKHDNIWFTEHGASKIGFFKTSTHTFVETPTPTAGSDPYGITLAGGGKIWFAENTVPKIGSFKLTASGSIHIKEHTFSNVSDPVPTAHLITSDHSGNIWYSEGFAGQIGEWIPSTGTHTNIVVSKAPFTHISGIGVDSKNRIWFDDSLNAVVGYYDPSTGAIKTLTLSDLSDHPHDGLAVDSNDTTWFTEEFGGLTGRIAELQAGAL
jgi:virginiamycin B lyase